MTWPRTLRLRLALWAAGLLLAVLAAFGAFVYFDLARGLATSLDDSLRLSATQALAAVTVDDGRINLSEGIPRGSGGTGLSGRDMTLRVLDTSGTVIKGFGEYQSWPATAASLDAARHSRTLFETLPDPDPNERTPVRFYTAPVLASGQVVAVVQVAQDLGTIQATLSRLLKALLLGGPVLVLVAGLGGYTLATRALAPIDQITQTARRIAGGADLSARLNLPATDDEVGRLALTFDQMLARLDETFRRERQFTADASHELRTPLAAMQAILGVIRQERRSPDDYEQALSDLAEEANRLQGLVEDLLTLARRDSQPIALTDTVNLSDLLIDVIDSVRPLAEAKGLALAGAVPAGLCLIGDTDSLIRLFVNLLDNAIKYTAQGGITVSAQAEPQAGRMTVVVADTGTGIAPEHLPHIFNRFYRADGARTAHSAGLGLAIALGIARAHNGRIDVTSAVGQGTRFSVVLPGAPVPAPRRR